jgi:hypothetical protein
MRWIPSLDVPNMPSIGASDYVGSLLKVFAKPFQDQEQVHNVPGSMASYKLPSEAREKACYYHIVCFFSAGPA